MHITLQHVIGTISILVLTISVGLSFTVVASFVQTDINKKEMAQLASYVSLNLVDINNLASASGYAPTTMVKNIELPTELGGRAYTIELIDATDQGKGYLVRVSLAAQPSVSVESIIPFNNTTKTDQTIVATTSTWSYTWDLPPEVAYSNKLYGGNNVVVWAHREDASTIYLGMAKLAS